MSTDFMFTDTPAQMAERWRKYRASQAPNAASQAQEQPRQQESAGVAAIDPIIKTVTKTAPTPTNDAPAASPAVAQMAGTDNLTPEDNAAKYMFAGPSTGRQGMGQRARPSLAALLASSKAY